MQGTDKANILARLAPEQRQQLRSLIIERAEKILKEGKPLGFDALVIIAEKPSA